LLQRCSGPLRLRYSALAPLNRLSLSASVIMHLTSSAVRLVLAVLLWAVMLCEALTLAAAAATRVLPLEKRHQKVAEVRPALLKYQHVRAGLEGALGSSAGGANFAPAVQRASAAAVFRAGAVEPLHGELLPLGEYYARLGVDGQEIGVQIDTGSANLAFAVSRCLDCPRSDGIIRLSDWNATRVPCSDSSVCLSGTCSGLCGACSRRNEACCSFLDPESCGMILSYADGSYVFGALHQGPVSLPGAGLSVRKAFYTAILYDSPTFERRNVGGIWGLAFQEAACSPSCPKPLFDIMFEEGVVARNIFSICLSDTGGALILGAEADTRFRRGPYSWVRYLPRSLVPYYAASVKEFRVGPNGSNLRSYADPVVFDSGTTLMALGGEAFTKVIQEIKSVVCAADAHLCHSRFWSEAPSCTLLSDAAYRSFPDITIRFDSDATLNISRDTYLIRAELAGELYYCLGLEVLSPTGALVVIGDLVLRRFTTVFNRENSSIGFAPSVPGCGQ
jgi:hypothetical protein